MRLFSSLLNKWHVNSSKFCGFILIFGTHFFLLHNYDNLAWLAGIVLEKLRTRRTKMLKAKPASSEWEAWGSGLHSSSKSALLKQVSLSESRLSYNQHKSEIYPICFLRAGFRQWPLQILLLALMSFYQQKWNLRALLTEKQKYFSCGLINAFSI